MSCYCDYDSGPEFFREKYRIAKKEHKCCECGRSIYSGEGYQYVVGIWEGDFATYKTCDSCASLRDSLSGITCTSYKQLKSDYAEYLYEVLNLSKDDFKQQLGKVFK